MKKLHFFILIALISTSLYSQIPQSFSYQAVARDADGNSLQDQQINVRISILSGSDAVWTEEHSATTNNMGLFSLVIGSPSANGSGTAGSFDQIYWGDAQYSIGIELDTGNGYVDLGASPLQSVPYALYAANGGSGSDQVWISARDTLSTLNFVGIGTRNTSGTSLAVQGLNNESETPLFEVRREDGMPVFAVFNDGVMVYVDEQQKGVKGGFAVGGYNSSKAVVSQEYLRVTKDSVRIYVPEDHLQKGRKGGFAVGGYNSAKTGNSQDLLFVTPDSIRLYVPNKENDPGYVGLQGGFAVETFDPNAVEGQPREYIMGMNRGITRFNTADNKNGFAIGSQGEGWSSTYMQVTPLNTFVGFESGANTRNDPEAWNANQGARNVFLGYKAGQGNIYGNHNVLLGYQAGLEMVGDSLDDFDAAFNVFVGANSGRNFENGFSNIFIGENSGSESTSSFENIFIGSNSGRYTSEGSGNIAIGQNAGQYLSQYNNIMIGTSAGLNNVDGSGNIFLGTSAGGNSDGSNNIFIGNSAGFNESGDNLLYIDNSNTSTPLIWGNFDADEVQLNASVGINSVTGENRLTVRETRASYGPAAIAGINQTATNGKGIGVEGTGGNTGVLGFSYINGTGSRIGVEGYAYGGDFNYGVYGYGYGGSSAYAVYAVGNLGYTGSLVAASDQKFKENAKSLDPVMGDLMKVNPKKYQVIGNSETKAYGLESNSQYGFIAQELAIIFPELVVDVAHKSPSDPTSKVEANGNPVLYKGVKYIEMIPLMLKGMQEQQEEIERLKAELEAVKSKL